MERRSSRYSLAIVGAGFSGLAAAALLARQGRNVVLLDPSESAGGALAIVRRDGFLFSPGMDLTYGFDRGGNLETFCSDLGISLGASVLSPCYQIVLPDHRVNVYREQGETLEELRREFPADADSFVRFYREIRRTAERQAKSRISAFLASRRRSGPFLDRFRFSKYALAFLDASSLAFFQRPASLISLDRLVMLFDSAPLSVRNGFPFLAEQVAAFILKSGGEIHYGVSAAELIQRNGRSAGVRASAKHVYESDAILLNPPVDHAYSGALLGVKDDVIPAGMARNVFCLPSYEQRERFFTISVSPSDTAAAPNGMRSISAGFPFSPPGSIPFPRRLEDVAAVMPFLEGFLMTSMDLPDRKDICPYPKSSVRKPVSGSPESCRMHRTEMKNLFVVMDDPRSPMCSIDAARVLVKLIR